MLNPFHSEEEAFRLLMYVVAVATVLLIVIVIVQAIG